MFVVKPTRETDRTWIRQFVRTHWGSDIVVGKGRIHRPADLQGFIAFQEKEAAGLLTYQIENVECEVVTIDSIRENRGIGTAMVNAVLEKARSKDCRRLWLITTNDNLNALRFYQKRGFHLVAVYPDAVEASRKLKPQIPAIAENGIPIRDELELEMKL